MTTRTNPHAARVRHLIDSARRTDEAGLHMARDRFMGYAADILDTRRVPGAEAYRAQLADLQGAAR